MYLCQQFQQYSWKIYKKLEYSWNLVFKFGWPLWDSVHKRALFFILYDMFIYFQGFYNAGIYRCQDQHFFELGIPHKHYLVNVNFPGKGKNSYCLAKDKYFISGLDFIVSNISNITTNRGTTKVGFCFRWSNPR